MIAFCNHEKLKKHGKDKNGHQRYRCCSCGMTRTSSEHRLIGDMRLPTDKAASVLKLLLEGMSIRATERFTGVSRNTIMDLLVLVGRRCERFWRDRMKNLEAKDVECDEIWGFVGMKDKTRKELGIHEDSPVGDVYCYIAMERNTKLVLTYHLGKRSSESTDWFANELSHAVAGSPQITTDGYAPYTNTIPYYMKRKGASFAQLVKIFGKVSGKAEGRYSPAPITAIRKQTIMGQPNEDRICTSHVERQNLSIRMGVRRMTRLTNAYSKKWTNHAAAMALWLVWYNFGRKHMTLKTTPAQAHGLEDHAWTVEELLDQLNRVYYQ